MNFIDQAKKLADTIEDKVQVTVSHIVNSIDEATDGVKANATSVATSGTVIAAALKDLPRTAEELAREMPRIAYRLIPNLLKNTTDVIEFNLNKGETNGRSL